MYDKLPVPYGLLRYGVAADHQGTKSVATQFDRLFANPQARFIGNTELGTDVTMDELKASYDTVVLASGLSHDRPLDIPGADLPQVYRSGTITRLLNGHPDEAYAQSELVLGRSIAVVGQGNVAIDIIRLLTCADEALDGSDINDGFHGTLRGDIVRVDVIGRSGGREAKFDPVMIRELARVPGLRHVLHEVDLATVPVGKDVKLDALRDLVDPTNQSGTSAKEVEVHWWFISVPETITRTGSPKPASSSPEAVAGVVFTHDGGTVHLEVDSVVTAIGFVRDPMTVAKQGICPVSSIPADGKNSDGLFAIGWLKGNGRGTIPDQRTDARALAATIAAEVTAGSISTGASGLEPHSNATDFEGWRCIDLRERLGAGAGRCRTKISSHSELMEAARDSSLDAQLTATSASAAHDLAPGVPVTILFGTESGNAELVAEDLGAVLGERDDVHIADLASVSYADLDPARFYLLVCSTYGDGDVPSSATRFYTELQTGSAELGGVRFAVFGMGDASYTKTYSRGSELLTEAFEAHGATRVGEYGRHDAGGPVPATEAASEWAEGVLTNLSVELSPV